MDFDINSFEDRLKTKNSFDGNLVYGAKKFHSDTNRSGEGKPSSGGLIKEHAKVVIDTGIERYQRKDGLWEDVSRCPVCGSEERDFSLQRMGLDIYRCKGCTHRYLNPRIKFDEAVKIYSDDSTASDIYKSPTQKDMDYIKYSYGLKIIEKLNPPAKNKIMDLGCGTGLFLKIAQENGWQECIGIDANSNYADGYEANGKAGLKFINTTFESLDTDKVGDGYDCISLWNVLEHLYDLNGIVGSMNRVLKDNGLVFIMVPNAESLITRLSREMSPTFNWKHVSHFSPASLKRVFELNGFEEVFFETVITEIDNVKSYMSGEYPYHGYGDPAGLFDFITPEYIHKNNLGSRMIGVYKKC